MKTSQNGVNLIKQFEGCVLTAYWDYKGYSVGYGHLGVPKGTVITEQQAEQLLISDLEAFEKKVSKYDSVYQWNQNEFDALVSYAYNIGSIDKLVDYGKRTRAQIVSDWLNHDHAGGKSLPALTKRRNTELQYFRQGVNAMTENDITLCGHGSNRPSYKNMYTYLQGRHTSYASNGKTKGVVKVMRLKALTDAGRELFKKYYSEIIGRNYYDQNKREYVYVMYSNGRYYSDCSSSLIKTFEKCGYQFPWTLNTAGIYQSPLFEEVPVNIVNGHITNPEILKIGDCLLFRGNPSRPLEIGHVEGVFNMPVPATEQTYPCWIQSGNKWYRRLAEGVNAHGWLDINGHRYWFDEKGEMASGWKEIDNEWFYFQPSGGLEGALYVSNARGAQTILEVK